MGLKVLRFVVVVLFALAMVPVGAHLLARPNKIDMPREQYFITQAVYLGWAVPTGVVLISAIVASLVLTIAVRGAAFWLALAGFVLITATLVIFFIWTEPANNATSNWTTIPYNWRELRTQWEYSHTVNAVLTFIALCTVTTSSCLESPAAQTIPSRFGNLPARRS